jgi:hypothetical protein
MVKLSEGEFEVRFTYNDARPFVATFSNSRLENSFMKALVDGFDQLAGGYSRESATAFLASIRRFIIFLEATPAMLEDSVLAPNTIQAYRAWLAQDLSIQSISKNTILNCAIRLIKWLLRNRPRFAPADLNVSVRRFAAASEVTVRRSLTADEVKQVLRACQAEIDFYWGKFLTGRRLLDGGARGLDEEELALILRELLKCGYGLFPTQSALSKSTKSIPNLMRRVARLGGLDSMKEYCFLTSKSALPFYISVVAQTAGNTDAIMAMSRGALVEHEIFATSKFVTWEKRRGSREQRREFDTRRRYSPPNLIENVMEMTQAMVKFAPAIHQDKLFLHLGFSIPSVISRQNLHNRLAEFIARHALVDFDPSDLRRTSAELHDQAGGIFVAQQALNHAHAGTTRSYVDGNRKRQEFDKLIHRFQGQMLSKISGLPNESTVTTINHLVRRATSFGFDCNDPLAGVAPGTVRGKLCDKFQMCATCPGAIVVLDDVDVVARLLKTKEHLLHFADVAQQRGWGERFQTIYQPSLTILISITEKVDAAVLRRAEALLPETSSLPDLE